MARRGAEPLPPALTDGNLAYAKYRPKLTGTSPGEGQPESSCVSEQGKRLVRRAWEFSECSDAGRCSPAYDCFSRGRATKSATALATDQASAGTGARHSFATTALVLRAMHTLTASPFTICGMGSCSSCLRVTGWVVGTIPRARRFGLARRAGGCQLSEGFSAVGRRGGPTRDYRRSQAAAAARLPR